MPRIPTANVGVAARALRTNTSIQTTTPGSAAFGGAAGAALSELGTGLQSAGAGVLDAQERIRNREVANRIAQADFTRRELELRNEVSPDGSGYQDTVLSEYDVFIQEQN